MHQQVGRISKKKKTRDDFPYSSLCGLTARLVSSSSPASLVVWRRVSMDLRLKNLQRYKMKMSNRSRSSPHNTARRIHHHANPSLGILILTCRQNAKFHFNNHEGNNRKNEPINQSINRTSNQSINQSINRSINQSVNRTLDQSINQSNNQSLDQWRKNGIVMTQKMCIIAQENLRWTEEPIHWTIFVTHIWFGNSQNGRKVISLSVLHLIGSVHRDFRPGFDLDRVDIPIILIKLKREKKQDLRINCFKTSKKKKENNSAHL